MLPSPASHYMTNVINRTCNPLKYDASVCTGAWSALILRGNYIYIYAYDMKTKDKNCVEEKRNKHELGSRDSDGGSGVVGSLFAANVDEICRGADRSDGLRHFPDYERHAFLCFLYLSSLLFFFPSLAVLAPNNSLHKHTIYLGLELRRITNLWSINLTQRRRIESTALLPLSP